MNHAVLGTDYEATVQPYLGVTVTSVSRCWMPVPVRTPSWSSKASTRVARLYVSLKSYYIPAMPDLQPHQ
jgi:hypothetical protein